MLILIHFVVVVVVDAVKYLFYGPSRVFHLLRARIICSYTSWNILCKPPANSKYVLPRVWPGLSSTLEWLKLTSTLIISVRMNKSEVPEGCNLYWKASQCPTVWGRCCLKCLQTYFPVPQRRMFATWSINIYLYRVWSVDDLSPPHYSCRAWSQVWISSYQYLNYILVNGFNWYLDRHGGSFLYKVQAYLKMI